MAGPARTADSADLADGDGHSSDVAGAKVADRSGHRARRLRPHLHRDYHGDFDYNLLWKPLGGFPVTFGGFTPSGPGKPGCTGIGRRCRTSF